MIVDTIPFGYGPEILLLRLRTLATTVDRHVIVESDTTHSGASRAALWPRLVADDGRFAAYANRVTHHWVRMPHGLTPHLREEVLRDHTYTFALDELDKMSSSSMERASARILLADADEIPHPEAVRLATTRGWGATTLYGRYHEWYLDYRTSGGPYIWEYRQPLLLTAGTLPADATGSQLRARQLAGHSHGRHLGVPGSRFAHLAGWHFTLQGGAYAVREKLGAFAHTELSGMSLRVIIGMMTRKEDILRRAPLERVPADARHLPESVFTDLATFGGMLSQDGLREIRHGRSDSDTGALS